MTTAVLPVAPTVPGAGLGAALLAHLTEQLRSAERLLGCVLRQGAAIRERDV